MTSTSIAINEERLHQLINRAIVDFGAVSHATLAAIGDKLGLYKALAAGGPLTPRELAERTGTAERYIREWLNAQAAGGYVEYDAQAQRYFLSPEQSLLLAEEDSPAFFGGAFQSAIAVAQIGPERVAQAFRTGEGISYYEHDSELFVGMERFFRTGYAAHLVQSWIPSLTGIEAQLRAGARVADVGCGHGAATILLAQAYPRSEFVGFDYHQPSVAAATERSIQAGVHDRVWFEAASATGYTRDGFDLICMFDSLHDLGDPVAAVTHARTALKADGVLMLVEPNASDRVEENLNPVGRAFYGASTLVCTPCSLSQETGLALGAQAGEARIREVVEQAGFGNFRRASQTPFNLVFEARP
jgi:SAM-dependent methyltransferase